MATVSLRELAREKRRALRDKLRDSYDPTRPCFYINRLDLVYAAAGVDGIIDICERASDMIRDSWNNGALSRGKAQELLDGLGDYKIEHASEDESDEVSEALGRLRFTLIRIARPSR